MTRKSFLTIAAVIACSIGAIALFLPTFLLVDMKYATPGGSGIVMARTAGAFLLAFGVLNFLVRGDADSPTLRSVLLANAVLQLLILPVDPWAYYRGIFGDVMAFVPNTLLHLFLLTGFVTFWWRMRAA